MCHFSRPIAKQSTCFAKYKKKEKPKEKMIERNPPPGGGFFVGWFPNQVPGGRRLLGFVWSILGVVLQWVRLVNFGGYSSGGVPLGSFDEFLGWFFRGFVWSILGVVLQRGPLPLSSWSGNHPTKKSPRGVGFLSFFLVWVASSSSSSGCKDLANHWTKRMMDTRLTN